MGQLKKGEYAEIMTKYAEHIFRESISTVKLNEKIKAPDDTKREIDVITTLTSGEQYAFEVRDRKSVQGIDWIDQIVGKYIDLGFEYVWICTFDGCSLSAEAIKKLRYHNIGWRDFTLLSDNKFDLPPILMVNAVEIIEDGIEITVNGEKYEDLNYMMHEGCENISFKCTNINNCKLTIQENFDAFQNVDEFVFENKLPLEGVQNNFNGEFADIRMEIPLKHKVYVDYIDEEYVVKNNEEEEELLSTRNKSIFITGDTLVINFEYLVKLAKDTVIDDNFILNTGMLPQKYRNISKVKFIDASGEGTIIPMKMYGIKRG